MTTALKSSLISKLIIVDISPAVGGVSEEFKKYIAGMMEIEGKVSAIMSRKEADELMKAFEPVRLLLASIPHILME